MMKSVCSALVVACCLCSATASQAAEAAAAPETHQFDFLLGQWTLTGELKVGGLVALIHGQPKLAGSWKAWRAADGRGVEDDLKLTDASGNPASSVHCTRIFSRDENCWKIAGRDAKQGNLQPATARWQGDEMLSMGSGTNQEGKRYQSRTHYLAITPVSFRMVQDRSYDDGKTWEAAVVTLNARRAGG